MLFCPNFSNKSIKRSFDKLKKLFGEDVAYFLWNKNNGYGLDRYPNGQPSQLYQAVINDTNSEDAAIIAVAQNIQEQQNKQEQFYFSRKRTSDAKYNYGRAVNNSREDNIENLIQYYNKAYDFSSKLYEVRRSIQTCKKTLTRKFFDDKNADDESNKIQRVNAYENLLKSEKNPYIKSVYRKRNNDGSITVYVDTYTADEIVSKMISDYINNLPDDEILSQLQQFETDELALELYHINPKRVPELKQQIRKKNVFISDYEIDKAIDFLISLENNQENNAYVECCLKWLKAGTISLPRDNEKVRQAFDTARRHNIDVQQFSSPIEIIREAKPHLKFKEENVNIDEIPQFSFNNTVTTENGEEIKVYDVENTPEGQQAVCQLLHDTGLFDKNGKHVPFSPWCLSTYNVDNQTGKVNPTNSAKHYWDTYSNGKRQIAIFNGRPIAFNSSSSEKDEWWDFFDGHDNGFSGYDSVDKINLYSSQDVYEKKIKDDASGEVTDVNLGGIYYSYNSYGDVVRIHFCHFGSPSVDYLCRKNGIDIRVQVSDGTQYLFSIEKSFVSDDFYNRVRIYGRDHNLHKQLSEVINNDYLNLRNIDGTVYEIDRDILKQIFDVLEKNREKYNITVQDIYKIYNRIQSAAQIFHDKLMSHVDKTTSTSDQAPNPSTEQRSDVSVDDSEQQEASDQEVSDVVQESVVQILAQNANREINQPIDPMPRQNVINGLSTPYSSYYSGEEVPHEESKPNYILKDVRRTIREIARRKDLFEKYEEYYEKPVNEKLAKVLHNILKKYHFEILETSLSEVFGEDVLGAYDVFQKIIYLTNKKDRNAIVDAEEFSHAFIKMMGATYRKNLEAHPYAALYSRLRDLVEKTKFYEDAYKDYKNEYKFKNGAPDTRKIKEEALGKALAAALNNRYDIEHSFIKRILKWFDSCIDWFKSIFGKDTVSLEKELDKIAKNILHDNYLQYLEKLDHSEWNQVSFEDTIQKDRTENDSFGINFMQYITSLGGYVSGSMALRLQGKIYRKNVESLHDFDVVFPLELHKVHTHADLENHRWESQELLDMLMRSEGSRDILQALTRHYTNMRPISAFTSDNKVIINYMICDDIELYERFKNMQGDFNHRMQQFTQEEQDKIHLVDIFFNGDNNDKLGSVSAEGINFVNYRIPFEAKLAWSRPKDLIDYQLWQPFEREYKVDTNSAIFYSLKEDNVNDESETITEEFSFDQSEKIDKDLDNYLANQPIEESHSYNVIRTTDSKGRILLSLPSSTKEKPRQIVLEPQGDNKFYVHQKIWDNIGEKIPGSITDEEKTQLFDAFYEELPDGAEILLPKSEEGYYATRGAIAGLLRLSRDPRFEKGTPGSVLYEDKNNVIKTFNGTSFIKKPSQTKTVDQATTEWANQRQKEILGETQLQLAQAFGLTQQEDGSWTTTDNSAEGQLRVQFVNSMLDPGNIDFDTDSINAHTVISIGLNQADASTFNHELAHYYIRKFWNSKAVQDALDMVYVKEMGDYKNDPQARIAVEEALADYMTQRTIDSLFLTNIESQSYFQRFWESFNKMLYKVFNIKTNTAKNAILKQIIKSFLVNEKLQISVKRPKYVMHKGIMHQSELQRRKMRTSNKAVYKQLDRENFEKTVEKIVSAIQSKAKSYRVHSSGVKEGIYGDEQQMAFNQESVRVVKQFTRTVEQLQAAKDDAAVLAEKIKLFMDFLERADQESNRVLRLLKNARANDKYKRVAYTVDKYGNKHYDTPSNVPFVATQSHHSIIVRNFTWDDLVYAKNDIVDFFDTVVKNISKIAGRAAEYGINSTDAQRILDFINTTGLYNNILEIRDLYDEARRIKVLEWIDSTVDERTELDEDFKKRLKINMRKWLDNQMDFGDVGVFEKWAGMASMSKSPIIRAIQDEISRIQSERDDIVHKKGLELRKQLEKVRKHMGLKYRILPFNVQKLLVQLDKRGLPTGNFISEYNDGLYKQELENYKNLILFGKHGIENDIKSLGIMPKDWKLMVGQRGEPIFPDDPRLYQYEKEYHLLVEDFKGDREIRKFVKQYYIDRINTLSIPALRALNNIQQKINDITEAITIDGKPRLNLLTEDQQDLLVSLYNQLNQLGSMTNIDGTEKVPGTEEYEIAESIKKWRLKTQGKIIYSADYVAYKEAYDKALDKVAFSRRFTNYQVNPLIWEALRRRGTVFPESDPDVQELNSAKYDRSKLVKPLKGYDIGVVDWDQLFDESTGTIKNEEFFKKLKQLDTVISDKRSLLKDRYKSPIKRKPEPQVMGELNIPVHLVPGVTNWNASKSQYEFMIEKITQAIQNDNTLTDQQKIDKINYYTDLLTYHDASEDVTVPLSIFSVYLPLNANITTISGQKYASYSIIPVSIFQKITGGVYTDPRYDETKTGIQLTDQYKDKRYEKYFSKDTELSKLLNDLKATSQECFDMIPFLQRNDNRLPQIGARSGQILGRRFSTKWYNPIVFGHNFLHWLSREWEVYETDTSFLQVEEREVRPDGSAIQSIPIRFLKRLDDPEYISMDVVGSTIMLYNMAVNYKLKAENANKLASILNQLETGDDEQKSKLRQYFTTSQSEIIRDIYGRQLYEDQNESSNSKDNFIDTEWSHFDWIRRHVISNPATFVKRVRKSRASFQLGMLALNASSAVISFLDPLVSLTIDSITGKYINYKDIFYAAYKMSPIQGNLYGSIISLGSAKTYSKTAAAMQRFQLGKSNNESFKDLDQSQIMRFLSDGLTMKYFTLGDYTINTINMVATMHNYKYYKKQDGTAGFYPKHIFLKTVMDDKKCSIKDAKDEYESAVCMWESCKVNEDGDFVAIENEYGDAITKETWNDIRAQIRSRSSIYNGVVPDLERSLMQTNVIWSFITMLRNFFITGIWERFQSYNDFQVASLDENGEPVDRPVTKEDIKNAKRIQRYYKGGYNFATRQVEDGVDMSAFYWLFHIAPYLKFAMFMLTHKNARSKYSEEHKQELKARNIAQTDIYGVQKVFIEFIVFAILLLLSSITNKIAQDDEDDYSKQMLNLITLRLTIERATWMNSTTAMDLISSPTAALSDWRRKLKIFDLFYDYAGLSDYNLHDEVKRGRYVGAERWKYNLFNSLSSFGLNNWYADMPEELGGGGAKSVNEKTNFYRDVVKKIPVAGRLFPNKKQRESSGGNKKIYSN